MAGGAYNAGEDLLGVGALAGAVAAAHLTGDDGGPDGLFGAPVGGVDRRVPQKGEDGGEFDGQVGSEALGVVQRRRVVDQPAEPGEQSAAGGGQTVVAQVADVATVAQREAGLQGVLHLVVRHVIIFGHGHGLQRAIIDESQHRTPERLIMAQH